MIKQYILRNTQKCTIKILSHNSIECVEKIKFDYSMRENVVKILLMSLELFSLIC